jgi:hypothetical protein
MQLTKNELAELVYELDNMQGVIAGDGVIVDYEGRGTSRGRGCLAFVTPGRTEDGPMAELVRFGAALAGAGEGVVGLLPVSRALLNRVQVDSYGLDLVVYFPGITVEGEGGDA